MTYGEIYIHFRKLHPSITVLDYRPYPFVDSAIIIWSSDKDGVKESAYQYNEVNDLFDEIQNPITYSSSFK